MDTIFAIRAGIFFTAGLILILFPGPVIRWQKRVENLLVKKLHLRFFRYYTKFDEKKGMRANKIFAISCFIISIMLLIYSIMK